MSWALPQRANQMASLSAARAEDTLATTLAEPWSEKDGGGMVACVGGWQPLGSVCSCTKKSYANIVCRRKGTTDALDATSITESHSIDAGPTRLLERQPSP